MSNATLTIRNIRAVAVDAPMKRPVATASGTIPSAPLILIDVLTDEDITGRAYIFGYTKTTLAPLVALIGNLTESLVGKSVAPVERMREFGSTFRLLGRQGLLGMAISGLDMAFWDALGRAQDLPVAQLLGGETKRVQAYDSYGLVDAVRDRKDLETSMELGFSAVKIKLGGADLEADISTVVGVREVIGAKTRLMVDYNQSLSVPEAIRRMKKLADHDVYWVEEPVPAEDLAGHAEIRAARLLPVQTGENWWFPEDAARSIAASASDFAMLDIMKIGGVTGWIQAAGHAAGASLPVSSHLFAEASAHVLAVTPTAHYLEYLDIASSVLQEPVVVKDGNVQPTGSGLGIEWDNMAIKRLAI